MKKQIAQTLKANMAATLAALALSFFILHPAAARADADCSGYDDCLTAAEDAYDAADYESAVEYYEKACAGAPDSEISNCRDAASDAWLQKGDVSYNAEDYQSAIDDFAKAVELAPGKAKPYIYRGDAYKNNGNRPEAVADYSRALKIQPSNAKVYLARGDVYYGGGKYDAAIDDYTRSIELDPIGKAYYYRADAYLNSAKYDLGIDDYTKAMELDPSMGNVALYRGDCWMFKGEIDKALADYSRAMAFSTDSWKPASYIGEIYVMKRDKTKAIPALKKALDEYDGSLPDDEKGTLQLFYDTLTKNGGFPKTDDLLKEAKAAVDANDNPKLAIYAYANFLMQPQSPEANYFLATSYEKIGWKTSAIRYYRRYIYLSPGSKLNNVVREAIKSLEQ